MSIRLFVIRFAFLFSASIVALPSGAVDVKAIEAAVTGAGLEGWVHGSVAEKELFVFTYRNPENFFDYITMSLVATTADVRKMLAASKRHDKLKITGTFMRNPSPQIHIAVTGVEVVKEYKPAYDMGSFPYSAEVPKALRKDGKATFLVHAIGGDGHILVVEHDNQVVPIFARDTAYTAGLSRNDVIRLKFRVQEYPNRPRHLIVDAEAKEPVEVLERIADLNEQRANIEGALVMFPKSPEIIFNVFAVLQEKTKGFNRQFTIVNFEDMEAFKAAREKLQKAWDAHPNDYVNGRNKLVSTKVRVRVKGIYNQVSVNQANPQVLIKSADDITIIDK